MKYVHIVEMDYIPLLFPGVKCPTCNGRVEPQVLIQSFGNDFTYDTNVNKFVQISSGYYYDPVK